MELHQLRYFVATAEAGSFSAAAKRCNVAQPSLSQQIIKLEKELREPLFDRLGRRVALTRAGETLLGRAKAILASVDDAALRVKDGAGEATGRLVVGAIPTVAPYLLPPVLKRFTREFPKVELMIHETLTGQLLAGLIEGDIDVGLLALPVEDPRLLFEPLLTDDLLVALPPRHHLAGRKRLFAKDLRDEPFILLHEMHCLGQQVLAVCQRHGLAAKVACRGAQISTVQKLVRLGLRLSLLPAMAQTSDAKNDCVYRRLEDSPHSRSIAAVWHRDRYRSRAAHAFVETLRAL